MTASSILSRIMLGVALLSLFLAGSLVVGSLCAQSIVGNFSTIHVSGGLPFTEWWPVGTCEDAVAYGELWSYGSATVNGPLYACQAGSPTVFVYPTADFDDSATELIGRDFLLPTDWTGAIDLKVLWYSTATSGNVVWQVATLCTADGETEAPAGFTFNTAQTITDATKGTSSLLNTATLTPVTMTGCAAGELLHLKIFRDPAHASDTLGATAALVGVEFTYRRAL